MFLIRWDKLCMTKTNDDLGISSIKHRNISLLSKWWWRHRTNSGCLWNMILRNKYRDLDSLMNNGTNTYLSPMMHSILYASNFHALKLFSRSDSKWKAGNRVIILFWLDHWAESNTLKILYPRLDEL